MCGIVAYVGPRDAVPILLEGLQRLEYRGYDSAGIAVARPGGLRVHKRQGKVGDLAASVPKRLKGSPGIGHTRWATHGRPSDRNAHPHTDPDGLLAVVHNGIVENASELRAKLEADGASFRSETDTEVIAHLIARSSAPDLQTRVRDALACLEGAYGIAVVDARTPDRVVVARNGSPVVLGIGDRELFAASDAAAIVGYTRQVVHLEDGQLAVLRADGYQTTPVHAPRDVVEEPVPVTYDKGGFPHYLLKEIFEQPEAARRTLGGRLDHRFQTAHLGGIDLPARDVLGIRRIKILGQGSAYYAGRAGALVLEQLGRVPADAEHASEFRYRNPVVEPDALYIAVTQSGETFDTLAAVQEVTRKGGRVMGIVNVAGSTIARACGSGIYLRAGPEISVASTKTVTCTMLAFVLLGLHLGRVRDLGPADAQRIISGLDALPAQIAQVLKRQEDIAALARRYAEARSMLFIGRVRGYPVALEAAQKLKEVSYIHAEAHPAAELKHGPLALVDAGVPTVAIVPSDELLAKNLSSVQEIRARRGPVIAVTHEGVELDADAVVRVPRNEPELDPILLGIPLQLFAYHAAVALGRDVDRPRNLAKSVTVE